MTDQIQGQLMCEWEPSYFFFFSHNIDIPLVYYSHITTIVIFVLLFLLSFMKLKVEYKTSFRLMAFSYSVWLLGDIILWANEVIPNVLFFWTIVNLVEPLIFISAFWLIVNFVYKRGLNKIESGVIALVLLPTIIFTPTIYGIPGFDLTTCDRNAVEGITSYYNYFIEILSIFSIFIYALVKVVKDFKDKVKVRQTLILTGNITILLVLFLLANFIGTWTGNYEISQYGHIGVPIFAAALAYLIIKYESKTGQIIIADILVTALFLLFLSLFFVDDINYLRYIIIITFIIMVPVAGLLLKGVRKEIKVRVEKEELATDLRSVNNQLLLTNTKLEKANDRLKELDIQKTEFVSLATHQLRGPLGAIKGYASLILEGDYGTLPDSARRSVEVIMRSAQSMIVLVGDYLDISRIEQGRMKYDFTEFDLRELTETVINEFKPVSDIVDSTITLDYSKRYSFKIKADAGKIKQVISNLMDNSLKYSPKGIIQVSLEKNEKVITLKIKDNGVGIKPEVKATLFEKFSRAPDASKTNILGTGLGLFVARKIVETHGGKIWAESEGEGKGSTFIIELKAK